MNRGILVTAISGDVGNGILKCLAGCDRPVLGCDVGSYPAGLDRVSKFFRVPYASEGELYLQALEGIVEKNDIGFILPVNEEEIRLLGGETSRFKKAGVTLMLHQDTLLSTCMDKLALAIFLASHGLTVPESLTPESFRENGSEYLAKPRCSSGSHGIHRFRRQAELDVISTESQCPLIIQKYIPAEDNEYTIGVFSDGQQTRSIAFRRTLRNGYSAFVELVEDDTLNDLAGFCAKLFCLRGSINIQLRRYKGLDYIFEINPRLSGTAYFRHQLGFTDAIWWLQLVSGEEISPYKPRYHKAIGIREMNEKFLVLE